MPDLCYHRNTQRTWQPLQNLWQLAVSLAYFGSKMKIKEINYDKTYFCRLIRSSISDHRYSGSWNWMADRQSQQKTMDYSSLRLVQWAFNMIIKLAGIELTVIGEENISEGPVLYIGNHRSFFDIVITYARCKNLTGYIRIKSSSFKEGVLRLPQRLAVRSYRFLWILLKFSKIISSKDQENTCCSRIRYPIYPNELDMMSKTYIGSYVENIVNETIHKNAEIA